MGCLGEAKDTGRSGQGVSRFARGVGTRVGDHTTMNAIVDSNVLIYYLNAALPPNARLAVEGTIKTGGHISVITRIEILGWPGQTESAYGRAQGLLGLLTEHPLTNDI